MAATASRSTRFISGLVGDSIQTALAPSVKAARSSGIAQIHVAGCDLLAAQDAFEEPVRAAVKVAVDQDGSPASNIMSTVVSAAMPVAKAKAGRAALERGETGLQRLARRIAAARILEGTGPVDPAKGEGGGLVNGRHHRAQMILGIIPRVKRSQVAQ
jgi:hypothetical protein